MAAACVCEPTQGVHRQLEASGSMLYGTMLYGTASAAGQKKDVYSLHAGCPVVRGVKYSATKWVSGGRRACPVVPCRVVQERGVKRRHVATQLPCSCHNPAPPTTTRQDLPAPGPHVLCSRRQKPERCAGGSTRQPAGTRPPIPPVCAGTRGAVWAHHGAAAKPVRGCTGGVPAVGGGRGVRQQPGIHERQRGQRGQLPAVVQGVPAVPQGRCAVRAGECAGAVAPRHLPCPAAQLLFASPVCARALCGSNAGGAFFGEHAALAGPCYSRARVNIDGSAGGCLHTVWRGEDRLVG